MMPKKAGARMPMSVQKWLLRKIKGIDRERMKKHIDILAQESGKSKLYIEWDIFRNFLSRGVGYTDYFRGDYLHLTKAEKDTFVTSKSYYNLMHYLNDQRYIGLLNDKLLFNEFFRDYIRRDFVDLRRITQEEFATFLKGRDTVFAKIPNGECGHGIRKVTVSEHPDTDALYTQLMQDGQYLVEETILQCPEMNEINPYVVSSFRVVTLVKDGKAQVIANAVRVNQTESQVVGCTDDVYFYLNEEGRVASNVIDDYGNIYEAHPLTGKKFSEVQIPGVPEAFRMCREAAEKIPQVRYIGWDIAFSVNGPVIVEGNEYPGFGFLQFYKLTGSHTGHLKQIADVLGDEMKQIKL